MCTLDKVNPHTIKVVFDKRTHIEVLGVALKKRLGAYRYKYWGKSNGVNTLMFVSLLCQSLTSRNFAKLVLEAANEAAPDGAKFRNKRRG